MFGKLAGHLHEKFLNTPLPKPTYCKRVMCVMSHSPKRTPQLGSHADENLYNMTIEISCLLKLRLAFSCSQQKQNGAVVFDLPLNMNF